MKRYNASHADTNTEIFEHILRRLKAHKERGQFRAQCPVHKGKSQNSLSIADGDTGILLHCHSGCAFSDVVAALDLKPADLFHHHDHDADPIPCIRRELEGELNEWADRYLTLVCRMLRTIEADIDAAVPLYEHGKEDGARLALLYRTRSNFESKFWILLGNDFKAKRDLRAEVEQ